MVKNLSRRDALKLGAVGLGAGLLALSPFTQEKKKKENNMTIGIDGFGFSDYKVGFSTYTFDSGVRTGIQYPGLIVSVAIFGTGSVSSVLWQGMNLGLAAPAVVNGIYRIEHWYLLNPPVNDDDVITVNLSGSLTSIAGAATYQYFGGIGKYRELASTDVARVDFEAQSGTLITDNSIVLASMCVSATSGVNHDAVMNNRWDQPVAAGTFIGADLGPISPISPTDVVSIAFNNPSTLDVFAMSAIELLDYTSPPPAIMGM